MPNVHGVVETLVFAEPMSRRKRQELAFVLSCLFYDSIVVDYPPEILHTIWGIHNFTDGKKVRILEKHRGQTGLGTVERV